MVVRFIRTIVHRILLVYFWAQRQMIGSVTTIYTSYYNSFVNFFILKVVPNHFFSLYKFEDLLSASLILVQWKLFFMFTYLHGEISFVPSFQAFTFLFQEFFLIKKTNSEITSLLQVNIAQIIHAYICMYIFIYIIVEQN